MLGLPEDPNLDKTIMYFLEKDIYTINICHGLAAFLAAKADPFPYAGYRIAAFPGSIDKPTPMIGYLQDKMPCFLEKSSLRREYQL
jgi:molecular chaperone Hsp31 and glyoxalase 3